MEYDINPEYSIDIGILQQKVQSLRIQSETDNIHASELLGEIDNLLQSVASRRDGIIEIYEQRIAETRQEYQPDIKTLETLKRSVKDMMLEYKRRAKEKIQQVRQDMDSGKIERSEVYLDESGKIINETALSIRTGEGLSSHRKYFKVTVTDFSKIPDSYKSFDRKAVLKDARKGVKDIPGILIEEKEAIQYRTKKAV